MREEPHYFQIVFKFENGLKASAASFPNQKGKFCEVVRFGRDEEPIACDSLDDLVTVLKTIEGIKVSVNPGTLQTFQEMLAEAKRDCDYGRVKYLNARIEALKSLPYAVREAIEQGH